MTADEAAKVLKIMLLADEGLRHGGLFACFREAFPEHVDLAIAIENRAGDLLEADDEASKEHVYRGAPRVNIWEIP